MFLNNNLVFINSKYKNKHEVVLLDKYTRIYFDNHDTLNDSAIITKEPLLRGHPDERPPL